MLDLLKKRTFLLLYVRRLRNHGRKFPKVLYHGWPRKTNHLVYIRCSNKLVSASAFGRRRNKKRSWIFIQRILNKAAAKDTHITTGSLPQRLRLRQVTMIPTTRKMRK